MSAINFFVILRILLGLMFIASGSEKLLLPYQNFVYVIQSYEILHNAYLENLVAIFFPWLEVIVGCHLILGLWTKYDLFMTGAFGFAFFIFVGRAMLFKLPISECGCFGDLIHMPLSVTFSIDILTVVSSVFCILLLKKTNALSLDDYFGRGDS